MLLKYVCGRYNFYAEYSERYVPGKAGFYFDKRTRLWTTLDPDIAARLIEYADEQTTNRINAYQNKEIYIPPYDPATSTDSFYF